MRDLWNACVAGWLSRCPASGGMWNAYLCGLARLAGRILRMKCGAASRSASTEDATLLSNCLMTMPLRPWIEPQREWDGR